MSANLEHVNMTVSNPDSTAQMLCDVFDWKVRWKGESKLGGNTVHVGTDGDYLAVYAYADGAMPPVGRLNHVGILVDDLAETQKRVEAAGFDPYSFGDYEPGRRFYFNDFDDNEYEVVSYN